MKKQYIKPCTETTQMGAAQLFATSVEYGTDTTDVALTREQEGGIWDYEW